MSKELEMMRKRAFTLMQESNEEKQKAFDSLNNKIRNVLSKPEILDAFDNQEETVITYNELKLFKIGQRNEVNDGVYFEKTYEDSERMTFLTYMMDGGSFGVHKHNCLEACKIIKGALIEKTRNYTAYGEGQTIYYPANELHTPYATVETLLEVTFYKNMR